MRIQLKNFRCHLDGEVTLPDSGLVLLTGQSGAGKSTILNALAYAFYGRLKKPYSHGKTTCSVSVEYTSPEGMEMVVVRTSKPNRLIVTYEETKYEDEAGQGVIDGILGVNYEEFVASSYIVQNLDSSVLSMTPTESIAFVEDLAFEDDTHEEVKKKIKIFSKDLNSKLNILEGELGVYESMISNKEKAVEDIVLDFNEEEVYSQRDDIEEEVQEVNLLLKEKNLEMKKIRRLEETNRSVREERITLEGELNQLAKMKNKKVLSEEELDTLEEELFKLQDIEKYNSVYLEYIAKCDELKKFKKSYRDELGEKLSSKRRLVLKTSDFQKLQQRVSQADENSKAASLYREKKKRKEEAKEKIGKVKAEVEEFFGAKFEKLSKLKEFLSNLCSGEIYKCPSCSTSLTLKEGLLEKVENESSVEDYSLPEGYSYHEPTGLLLKDGTNYLCSHTCQSVIALWINTYPRVLKKPEMEQLLAENIPLYSDTKLTVKHMREIIEKEKRDPSPFIEKEEGGKVDEEILNGWKSIITKYEEDYTLKLGKEVTFDMNSVLEDSEKLSADTALREEITVLENKLEKKILPPSLVSMENRVKELKESLPKGYKFNENNKEVLEDIRSTYEEGKRVKKEMEGIEKEYKEKKKALKKLPTLSESSYSTESLEEEISNLNERLEELNEKRKKNNIKVSKLLKAEGNQSLKREIKELKREEGEKRDTLDKIKNRLSGFKNLESISKTAEILAVERTVESINQYAKFYLDKMFEDEISVRLETFKRVKKDEKPSINVRIEYKGDIYGSVDELSGGERQRCNLAFLLAVNEMAKSPILLLDECINNLDAEVHMEVLDIIKDFSSDKLILVVSHEAIHGIFDDIINV